MMRVALIAALVAVVILGVYIQPQFDRPTAEIKPSDQQITKCITKDGETIYGNVTTNKNCKSIEIVETAKTNIISLNDDIPSDSSTFRCDGREHCSQMGSCAEAQFFQSNCPNTKMDGDRDGVPCESQWCN